MPAMPPRKINVPRPPIQRAAPPPEEQQPEPQNDAAPADDGSVDESYLSYGAKAKETVKASQEANAFRGYREFFITKAEVEKAKQAGEQGVTVRVHFVRNYANPAENVSVPRCTIMQAGRPVSFTSAGPDCALAAAGVPVSIRPVYMLIDHRRYARQDKTTGFDDLKMMIPPPNFMGVMENAIKNLAENLGCDPSQVDITKHEAKLTKIAAGRSTTWAIDFVIKQSAISQVGNEAIAKAFQKDGYRKTLAKWLAPNTRYMISKGGHYVMPPRQPAGAQGGYAQQPAGNDEPPY